MTLSLLLRKLSLYLGRAMFTNKPSHIAILPPLSLHHVKFSLARESFLKIFFERGHVLTMLFGLCQRYPTRPFVWQIETTKHKV